MKGDYELRLNEAEEKIKEILESYNLGLYPNEWEDIILYCKDDTDYEVELWNGQTFVKGSAI